MAFLFFKFIRNGIDHDNSNLYNNTKTHRCNFLLFNNLTSRFCNVKNIAQCDHSLLHQGLVLQARQDIRKHSEQSGGHSTCSADSNTNYRPFNEWPMVSNYLENLMKKFTENTVQREDETQELKSYVGFVLSDINIIATSMIPRMAEEGCSLQDIKDRVDLLTEAFLYTRLKVLGEGRKLIKDISKHQAILDEEIATLIKENKRNRSLGDKFI